MKLDNKKIQLFLIDSVSDDYYNLWEPYSELKGFLKIPTEENIKIIFCEAIKSLYLSKLINFYKGVSFSGEEKEVKLYLTENLLNDLLSDWSNNQKHEIRVTTTKKADDYLKDSYSKR